MHQDNKPERTLFARKTFANILIEVLSEQKVALGNALNNKLGFYALENHFDFEEDKYLKSFIDPLSKDPQKLDEFYEVIRFYYFNIKNPDTGKLTSDLALILIFSIIEKMMSRKKFVDLADWLKNKFSNNEIKNINTSADLEKVLSDYNADHGSTKKARKFFSDYYPKDKLQILTQGLERLDVKKETTVEDLIQYIIEIRNGFIHSARYTHIPTKEEFQRAALGNPVHYESHTLNITAAGKKQWLVRDRYFLLEDILDGFELALINHYLNPQN
ncbi:MAG: hypothetical protein AAB367_04625 [Patescibacteria group bacterium]